jgi:hypothetical protein
MNDTMWYGEQLHLTPHAFFHRYGAIHQYIAPGNKIQLCINFLFAVLYVLKRAEMKFQQSQCLIETPPLRWIYYQKGLRNYCRIRALHLRRAEFY